MNDELFDELLESVQEGGLFCVAKKHLPEDLNLPHQM